MSVPPVCVSIVTHNSRRYIRRCLEAVLSQHEVHLEVVVVDNASTDGTLKVLSPFRRRIRLIRSRHNLGFAAAQNLAIRHSSAPWVLALNPDVLLTPGFLRSVIEAADLDPRAGSVSGKLLSIGPGFTPLPEPRIDSTGIYFTPAMRHFDRGWHELDEGRFQRREYVFGASAAAALYRREMIEDISIDGEFFDPDFFTYREDADVAWRAQLMGWRCIYTPSAVAHHVRTVSPENRRSVSPVINMHSVKNRFLLRIKNATPGLLRRCWWSMLWRDLVVVGGCLLVEPASLRAFWELRQCARRAMAARRIIMARRRTPDETIAQWFDFKAVAQPITTMEIPQAVLTPVS
ncbi:MAG: glycosyltransferase family 2 protein [Terriglobia bacterium]|nr:MAG: glycosyltransferase family 2 protein [Terriglobia bacterium]